MRVRFTVLTVFQPLEQHEAEGGADLATAPPRLDNRIHEFESYCRWRHKKIEFRYIEYEAEIDIGIDGTIRDNISICSNINEAGTRSDVLTSKMIALQLPNKDDG